MSDFEAQLGDYRAIYLADEVKIRRYPDRENDFEPMTVPEVCSAESCNF